MSKAFCRHTSPPKRIHRYKVDAQLAAANAENSLQEAFKIYKCGDHYHISHVLKRERHTKATY